MLDKVSREAKLEHRAIPDVRVERDASLEILYKETEREVVIYEVNSENTEFVEKLLKEIYREGKKTYVYAYGNRDTKLLKRLGFKTHLDYSCTDGSLYKRVMVAN